MIAETLLRSEFIPRNQNKYILLLKLCTKNNLLLEDFSRSNGSVQALQFTANNTPQNKHILLLIYCWSSSPMRICGFFPFRVPLSTKKYFIANLCLKRYHCMVSSHSEKQWRLQLKSYNLPSKTIIFEILLSWKMWVAKINSFVHLKTQLLIWPRSCHIHFLLYKSNIYLVVVNKNRQQAMMIYNSIFFLCLSLSIEITLARIKDSFTWFKGCILKVILNLGGNFG